MGEIREGEGWVWKHEKKTNRVRKLSVCSPIRVFDPHLNRIFPVPPS